MSRAKGKATKLMEGASQFDKKNFAMFGDHWASPEQRKFIAIALHWSALFNTHEHGHKISDERFSLCTRWKSRENFKTDLRHWTDVLLTELRQAVRTGNTSYLRGLSDAIEAWHSVSTGRAIDPERKWLLDVFFDFKTHKQTRIPTLREVQLAMKQSGFTKDDKHLRNMCSQVGLKLRRDKIGAPKKKSGNSRRSKPVF